MSWYVYDLTFVRSYHWWIDKTNLSSNMFDLDVGMWMKQISSKNENIIFSFPFIHLSHSIIPCFHISLRYCNIPLVQLRTVKLCIAHTLPQTHTQIYRQSGDCEYSCMCTYPHLRTLLHWLNSLFKTKLHRMELDEES